MEPLYARLGLDVRRLRKRKGLTQAELAQLIDPDGTRLGRTSIANIERGTQRVALHLFLDLATALDVDPKELLPRESRVVPNVAEKVGDLPVREQEWLMTVFSERAPRSRTKKHAASA